MEEHLQDELYRRIKQFGGIQVDATPWFERITEHKITGIHFVATSQDITQKAGKEAKKPKGLHLGGAEDLILGLDKCGNTWTESYVGVPIVAYANDNGDLAYGLSIQALARNTVTSPENISELSALIIIPNRNMLNSRKDSLSTIETRLQVDGEEISRSKLKANKRFSDIQAELVENFLSLKGIYQEIIYSLPPSLEADDDCLKGVLKLNHFLLEEHRQRYCR